MSKIVFDVVLEILNERCSAVRPVEVDSDQIETLRTSMIYHVGESQHTQNTQINEVTGENKKCVFYFMEKTKLNRIFGQSNSFESDIQHY